MKLLDHIDDVKCQNDPSEFGCLPNGLWSRKGVEPSLFLPIAMWFRVALD